MYLFIWEDFHLRYKIDDFDKWIDVDRLLEINKTATMNKIYDYVMDDYWAGRLIEKINNKNTLLILL